MSTYETGPECTKFADETGPARSRGFDRKGASRGARSPRGLPRAVTPTWSSFPRLLTRCSR